MKEAGKMFINKEKTMYRVDTGQGKETSWGYENSCGDLEYVEYTGETENVVCICATGYESLRIFVEDIPHLIKALQAAYATYGSPT